MQVRLLRPSEVNRVEWDRFCAQCHASYLGLSNSFRWMGHGIQPIEIVSQGGTRIAQCAIRVYGSSVQFVDSLVLDPADQHKWLTCMRAVLEAVGGDRFVCSYGSPWSLEQSIQSRLLADSGFVILDEQHYRVDAIDLEEYGEPDRLFRACSENMRRQIKRASKMNPVLRHYTGMGCLLAIHKLIALHRHTYRRKGLHYRWLKQLLSLVKNSVTYGERASISLAEFEGKYYAGMFSVQHDSSFFYVRGGTIPNKLGLSHYLHWKAIEDCFERGQRFYVMGYAYDKDLESPQLAAQRSFKKKFRTKEFPGSIVRFQRVVKER